MTPDPKGYARDCPIRSLEDLSAASAKERWEYKTHRFMGERGTALEIQLMKGAYKEFEATLAQIRKAL